jgi:hypothetical protein
VRVKKKGQNLLTGSVSGKRGDRTEPEYFSSLIVSKGNGKRRSFVLEFLLGAESVRKITISVYKRRKKLGDLILKANSPWVADNKVTDSPGYFKLRKKILTAIAKIESKTHANVLVEHVGSLEKRCKKLKKKEKKRLDCSSQ